MNAYCLLKLITVDDQHNLTVIDNNIEGVKHLLKGWNVDWRVEVFIEGVKRLLKVEVLIDECKRFLKSRTVLLYQVKFSSWLLLESFGVKTKNIYKIEF